MWQAISGATELAMGLFGKKNSGAESARAMKMQYENNLKLQKQAQAWNEYMYKNRYQMQVDDLEAAGINKLYGLGTAPAVTSGLNSVGLPDTVGEQNNKANQALKAFDLTQNLSARRAQIKKLEQETKTEEHNTRLRELQGVNQMINNIKGQKDLKTYDQKAIQDLEKQRAEIIRSMAEANESRERAVTAREQTKQIKESRKEIERINSWHEKNKRLSELLTGSKELSDLSKIIMGIGGASVGAYLGGKKLRERKFSARHRQ